MSEIVIRNPSVNHELLKSWSLKDPESEELADSILSVITPKTHPLVVDLCSGTGSFAAILIQRGWDPLNVTCIDQYKSYYPNVPESVKWKYWDLETMAEVIKNGRSLPGEVTALKETFDLVVLMHGTFRNMSRFRDYSNVVCKYLAKPPSALVVIS